MVKGSRDRASDSLEIHQAGWRGWERENIDVRVGATGPASPGEAWNMEEHDLPLAASPLKGVFLFLDRLGQASC